MAIDAGIYSLAGRGVKSVAEYDAEAAQGQQNKLALMMGGMKMDEAKRGIAGENALAQLLAGGKSGADVATGLASQGFGSKAMDYTKQQGEQAKQKAATEKDQLANAVQKIALGAQLLGGAKDQASYDAARATAQANGLDVSRMPPAFDPAFVQSKLDESMDMKTRLEQKWKAMEYSTPNANAVLSAQTQATGQQIQREGQQIQIRGQDMTDQRTRDFNSTKVEENKLKRDAKDETTNLTKSSQLASFDTMLGTLDRLGQHPGLARSVGAVGVFPTMPGSDSANFQAELNSFQSQAFIPMVAQLKGMGALSDAEGKKLTAAVGALDPKMGEQAFRDSVARITADMQAARARMAGGGQPAPGEWRASTGTIDATKPQAAPVSIKNAADYANIPSGATYIAPDGQMRVKK